MLEEYLIQNWIYPYIYLPNFSMEVSQLISWETYKKLEINGIILEMSLKNFGNISNPDLEISSYWPKCIREVAKEKTDIQIIRNHLEIVYKPSRNVSKISENLRQN